MGEILPGDDVALVAALRGGQESAAQLLIERFHAVVFGLCLRMMGHRQDAEDVVQETFVRALRGIRGFDGSRPLQPWLIGIAANRCRTALRRRSRRPILNDFVIETADANSGLPDPDDLAGELARALQLLRPDYRTVFCLYHEQGLAYDEIGLALNRPVGTIKTWLHRARAEMAEHLTRRGLEP